MKKLLILMLVFSLSGCIGLHVLYTRMHVYVINKLDDNFDLNRKQKEYIRNRVVSYQKWQKTSEMGLYRNFLIDLKTAVNHGATPEDVTRLWDRVFYLYDRSARYMMPDLVTFMKKLNNSQIEIYMKRKSESDSRKKLFLDYPDEEYTALSHARQIKQLEKYFGTFSTTQIRRIKKIYDYDKLLARDLMYDDINARSRFSRHMIYMRNDAGFDKWMESVFLDTETLYAGEELKRREIFRGKQKRRLYELSLILTPEQKAFFSRKVDDLIDEINRIAEY